jgi:hypothetical protein
VQSFKFLVVDLKVINTQQQQEKKVFLIKLYLDGLISTRFSQRSIINTDFRYDGLITNSTARGQKNI